MVDKFPNLNKEIALLMQGYFFIAGLDEAGRGAWAGPVVAAAVVLPVDDPELVDKLAGLNDSKQLSPKRREALFEIIQTVALSTAVGVVPATVIDTLNILAATRQAMQTAVQNLSCPPDYLLIDHVKLPTINIPQMAFAKADSISLSVAAASVIAKVTRDRLMVKFAQQHPVYGFDRHKGYGTKAHQSALADYGPCPIHRLSFKPLQRLTE